MPGSAARRDLHRLWNPFPAVFPKHTTDWGEAVERDFSQDPSIPCASGWAGQIAADQANLHQAASCWADRVRLKYDSQWSAIPCLGNAPHAA